MVYGWELVSLASAALTVYGVGVLVARRGKDKDLEAYMLQQQHETLLAETKFAREENMKLRAMLPAPPKAQPSPEPDPNQDLYDAIEQAAQDYEKDQTR